MGDSLCCLTNFQYLRSWYGLYQAFFPVRESMVCYDSVLNGSQVDSVSLTDTTPHHPCQPGIRRLYGR
jgi:hypothetical protein